MFYFQQCLVSNITTAIVGVLVLYSKIFYIFDNFLNTMVIYSPTHNFRMLWRPRHASVFRGLPYKVNVAQCQFQCYPVNAKQMNFKFSLPS